MLIPPHPQVEHVFISWKIVVAEMTFAMHDIHSKATKLGWKNLATLLNGTLTWICGLVSGKQVAPSALCVLPVAGPATQQKPALMRGSQPLNGGPGLLNALTSKRKDLQMQPSPVLRGCPHSMKANFGAFQTPPPLLVSDRQQLPNPPPHPRQLKSAFV